MLIHSNGRLLGAAICQLQPERVDDRMDALVFGRARSLAWRAGVSLAPALICGPCGTYGSHLIVHRDLTGHERDDVEQSLLGAMQTKAKEMGLPLAFVHVLAYQENLLAQLDASGFARTLLSPMAYLEIQWPTFDGYEKQVRKISRKAMETVRNERSRNAREGVRVEVLGDVRKHEKRLLELLNFTTQKHSGVPFWYSDDFFARLTENMGDDVVVYGAWKQDRLVGACVMLRSLTDGFMTEIGVDHELAGNDFTYFNVGYYHPIEDAIDNGLKCLHFDNALHETKARRGCRLINDYLYYKSDKPLSQLAASSLLKLHSIWFRRKHAHLDRYAHS